MELLISAMSAGGLVGVTNQYAFLIALSLASRYGLVEMGSGFKFMMSWPFIIAVAVLWVIQVAPAYASTAAPAVGNVLDAISGFVHGFVMPASSALVALASVGIIANLDPELQASIEAIHLINPNGTPTATTAVLAVGSSAIAMVLTGTKAVGKRSLGAATGADLAPGTPAIWATVESILSIVVVGLFIFLSRIDPRLLTVLLIVFAVIIFGATGYALYMLYRLAKGIGKVFRLIEANPRAGWAVALEAVAWGSGSLMWDYTNRATARILMWAAWVITLVIILPAATTFFAGILAVVAFVPAIIGAWLTFMVLIGGLWFGLRSAKSLMNQLEKDGHINDALLQPLPAS